MNDLKKIFLFTFALCLCTSTFGYKILVMCSLPSKSHHNLCRGISSILVERGHEVTFVGTFPKNNTGSREIVLHEIMKGSMMKLFNPFQMLNMSSFDTIKMMNEFITQITDSMFINADMNKLMNDKNEKFDAFVLEYFMNPHLIGFGVHFNCPTIILSPISLMTWLATLTDNSLSHAIAPNIWSPFIAKMNLWQRAVNTIMTTIQELMGIFYFDNSMNGNYEKYFLEESKRVSFHDLKYQIASTLVNTHPSAGMVRPLLPNTIEIGGYHIKDPEPLPEDIKSILDNAKNGIIFFSMGSNLKSSDMSLETRNTLLRSFSAVKETVLWKFEVDLPEKPKNVIIRDWLPQTGILDHPNVKVFISHGGLLSCTEATHFGKPMLIIPVFGDQYHNALEVTERGHGFFVQFENVTESSLNWALNEILTNEKYTLKAKHLQKLFHDRPIKPRDLVGFQIEHVIRTKGAPHLSPPRLPRYSQLLVDVALVLLIPIFTFISLVVLCCKRCFRKKSKKTKNEKLKKK